VPKSRRDVEKALVALGCADPARELTLRGADTLPSYLFVRRAISCAVPADDLRWLDAMLEAKYASDEATHAAKRLVASGTDRHDLAKLVHGMQLLMLSGACYLFDDPNGGRPIDLEDVGDVLSDVGCGFGSQEVGPSGERTPLRQETDLRDVVHELAVTLYERAGRRLPY